MTTGNELQNAVLDYTMNIFNSLSFYSPMIICVSILLFSMFTATIQKALVFFVWIFIITFLRIIVLKGFSSGNSEDNNNIPEICLTGITQIFIPKDVTYSTYILTFAMMYFLTPMIMISKQNKINALNYGVLAFFIAYISLDLFIKNSYSCIPGIFSKIAIGNILSGLFLGGIVSGIIMYGTNLKSYLYINELNSNKEVCSMPSKQQFKCSVYKDGTLLTNI